MMSDITNVTLHPVRSWRGIWLPVVGGTVFAVSVAAPGAVVAETEPPPTTSAVDSIVPHRAAYQFSLADTGPASALDAVTGSMIGEWRRDCEGWTVTQDVEMTLLDQMGGSIEIVSAYATWESIDGSEFSFSLRQDSGPLGERSLRGVASISLDSGVVVDYRVPDQGQETLETGTMFPVAHTIELLQRARDGERFFAATIFDGTELDWREAGGAFEVSAAIADIPPGDVPGDIAEAVDAGLLDGRAWRIRLAHFPVKGQEMSPEFETTMRLFDTGVSDRMQIDYGDFVVNANLTELDPLPAPSCN
jgi:hypothetical protein